jgi:ABC-type transport system substrate-binding protein
VLQNVYETLVTYSGNELSVFEPLLAESWELSEDGMTYSFQLHQGVKFHDGADMTASDVVYSFVRGMLQGGGSSPQFLIIEPFYGVGTSDISEMQLRSLRPSVLKLWPMASQLRKWVNSRTCSTMMSKR